MEVEGLGQAVPHVNKKCFCVTLYAYDNVGLHPLMKGLFLLKRLLETVKHRAVKKALGLESKFCI